VLDTFARVRGGPPRIDILCGTSVGAINACFLAAHLQDPTLGVRRLVDLWCDLNLADVLVFGLRQAFTVHRVLMGGGAETVGIFDVRPMAKLIEREIPWRAIARTLRRGHLTALSVSATEVASGRTVIFMQTGPDGALPTTAPPRTVIRGAHIGPPHALASAAIPILFPHVRIGRELFMDGGVRQNTPIAPALRLGATHVFAVGLSRELRGLEVAETTAPGAAFLLGKILNAFLLDHIQSDFEILTRVNHLIEAGEQAFGEEFLSKINAAGAARGRFPYRRIESLVVRPSEDIGRLAAEHVRSGGLRAGPLLARQLLNLVDVGVASEADLASYILFDGPFARKLIDLGRADAEARRHDIAAFFGSASDDLDPNTHDSGEWLIPPPVH
jgi:NTE family protein